MAVEGEGQQPAHTRYLQTVTTRQQLGDNGGVKPRCLLPWPSRGGCKRGDRRIDAPRYRALDIQQPTTSIEHRASSIEHRPPPAQLYANMSKKSALADAWDDDWESLADVCPVGSQVITHMSDLPVEARYV